MEVTAPKTHDFSNWDSFYQDALRYHKATHPDNNLVSERIATLRGFMSERVVSYLAAYVRPHPRFNTTIGWDKWTEDVMDVLRERDESIGQASSVHGWLTKFKLEKVTYFELWDELDILVSTGEISSASQRQLFWDNISWEQQERLAAQCPFFDPANEVWAILGTPQAEEAEQKISSTMELVKLDENVRQTTTRMVWRVGIMLSVYIVLALLVWWSWFATYDYGAAAFLAACAVCSALSCPELVLIS